ncbi:MAG: CTP synthase [Gammaproteobacteria bacterium]|nr:CTP synthase [Gammaproteobacteria bacterium]
MKDNVKFIFVTGGVISGIGKGITFASIGRLLKERGYNIFAMKLDPYLNFDPGTMSPYQHGEVFVTKDGGETDLDLGHYERFIDVELSKQSSVTSGRVYQKILTQERKGFYNGRTVQVIPHVTNEIKNYIKRAADESNADIVMVEVGGTVGDIESEPFLEAIRQMRKDCGYDNTFYIHVTLVPFLEISEEYKTKPTQHSVKELRGLGISPDLIVLRSRGTLPQDIKDKTALFCDVLEKEVINAPNASNIFELPILFESQNVDDIILSHFKFPRGKAPMVEWREMVKNVSRTKETIKIALVGKYVKLHDAYLSVSCALSHAGYALGRIVDIKWVESETINPETVNETFKDCKGIIIPGGFGDRGTRGMIETCRYARENNVPLLGICLGMQVESIEFARNVLNLVNADSIEFNQETEYPIIHYLNGQFDGIDLGGTLRLGNYECDLKDGSLVKSLYNEDSILERHRHRYEFNSKYLDMFEKNGFICTGSNPQNKLVEILELKNHPFYVGVQFHPEFKSRPLKPHPLFLGLIKASLDNENKN